MTKLNYYEFKRHIDDIQKVLEFEGKVADIFNEAGGEFYIPTAVDNVVDLLVLLMDDKEGWISYFVYELDFGNKYEDGDVKDKDGNNIPLETINDLWNILQ